MRILTRLTTLLLLLLEGCWPSSQPCAEWLREKENKFFFVIIEEKNQSGGSFCVTGKDSVGGKSTLQGAEYQLAMAVKQADKGDTLCKNKGSLDYFLKKKNGIVLKFIYLCPDN